MENKRIPFLVRLHKDTRQMLVRAAEEDRRSMSAIIDECVRLQLQARYSELQPRLNRFLSGAK